MLVTWTAHLRTLEDRERFQDMIQSSSKVLERLKDILLHDLQALESPKEEDFESPSWDKKMAFNLGQHKVLAKVIQLLTID